MSKFIFYSLRYMK